MIDWVRLLFNAAWLAGLSLILAALSYASWRVRLMDGSWRAEWKREPYQLALWSGLALVALGLAGTATPGWQRWTLGVLALLAAGTAAWIARLRPLRGAGD